MHKEPPPVILAGALTFRGGYPLQSYRLFFAVTLASFFFAGCGDTYIPSAREALEKPLGTGPEFTLGSTKDKVLDSWGPPDMVLKHGMDEIGNVKEEWIYHGRMQSLPIDVEYVSRDKHLFFEGDNMVRSETRDPRKGAAASASELAPEPARP